MSRVPRIRFKGFEEDWEQRKLGEIVVIERGGSPRPIEKYITESNDGLNWIKIGDAPVQGRYITKTSEKIKKSGLSKTRQVFPGDLILSNSMSFGKPYIMGIEGCIHDGWLVIKNKNNVFDLKFLCHMMSTEYLFNQYKMFAAGSTVNNLNKELVGNASVRFTKMLEQIKIGKHLESLDHLITLHQSKSFAHIFKTIDNSTLYWEQRKLGEVCNIITKQTGFDYSSTIKPALLKEKADNTYPFIQNKDFNGTTINMDTDFFIPISVAEKFPNIVLDRPSLLISISGRIGNVGFYSCVHKAFIGGAVGICKLKYNDDGKFIIHELESEYGQKYFHLLIKASSHANITVEDIRNMELIFPNKKEEKVCISTFFSTLDHLITLHQLEPYNLIFKAIAYRIIDYAKSKPPRCIK